MKKYYVFSVLFLIFMPLLALAFGGGETGLGGVAYTAVGLTDGVTQLVAAVSIIGGILFLMGALIQYTHHRKNPLQTPISKPLGWLFLGFLLVILPFLPGWLSALSS